MPQMYCALGAIWLCSTAFTTNLKGIEWLRRHFPTTGSMR